MSLDSPGCFRCRPSHAPHRRPLHSSSRSSPTVPSCPHRRAGGGAGAGAGAGGPTSSGADAHAPLGGGGARAGARDDRGRFGVLLGADLHGTCSAACFARLAGGRAQMLRLVAPRGAKDVAGRLLLCSRRHCSRRYFVTPSTVSSKCPSRGEPWSPVDGGTRPVQAQSGGHRPCRQCAEASRFRASQRRTSRLSHSRCAPFGSPRCRLPAAQNAERRGAPAAPRGRDAQPAAASQHHAAGPAARECIYPAPALGW